LFILFLSPDKQCMVLLSFHVYDQVVYSSYIEATRGPPKLCLRYRSVFEHSYLIQLIKIKQSFWYVTNFTRILNVDIYVGESKIIRTIGACFAVGYNAGWSWQNTHGLLLSYHCGAGVTVIVHFCHKFFCHKHGHSQFHLHQRGAGGSNPFLWAEGAPGVEMHRMMSVQYGNNVMSQRIVC